jgi:hypothetical protein
VFQEALTSLDDFRRATSKDAIPRSPICEELPIRWQLPPTGMLKTNWDVAVDKKDGRIGFGVVVRDFESFVLAAYSTTRNF